MDRTVLVMFPLYAGRELVAALDKDQFDVRAAFWLYDSDSGDWQLYIASPVVDNKGQLEAYKRIQAVLAHINQPDDNPWNELNLSSIAAISPKHKLVSALRKIVHVGPGDRELRFRGSSVDDISLDEVYIYRMP